MDIGVDASRTVTRQRTGTEAYSLHLVRELIPLAADRGHTLRLYFNRPPAPALLPEARHVQSVVIPFGRLWTHVRLAWELVRRPPDVFFTPAHVIPLTYRRPSVATVHDLGYEYFPDAHTAPQLAYLRWSTRHNGRRGRRIIADSLATKSDLLKLYDLDPQHVDVVYPGVDPQLRPVADVERLAAVQSKYGITPPYLLALGTLQPRKNLSRLVEAFAAMEDDTYLLVLAGKPGWHSQTILSQIENLEPAVRQRIIVPGFVDDEDKASLVTGANALLFPSLYEGFGFPVLEANACGTPVLCSDNSSLPEVAGDAALQVDPRDTAALIEGIKRIVGDQKLRRKLIEEGLANTRRFTWTQAAEQVLTSLEKAAT